MANAAYTNFKSGALLADFDLTVASVKAMLVRGYTFSAAHTTVADVTGAGGVINGTSAALVNPSVTGGVFDADDSSVSATASGSNHVLIVAQTSAVTGGADLPANQQLLIAYYDTGTGLPIQPGTGAVSITWSAGAAKIFALV
jgi:hypothetical protein